MATTARKPESKPMGKKLRCRFGFHRWRDFRSVDGDPYRKCAYCGKFLDVRSIGWFQG